MLYLILFVTGIPPLEERLLASRGEAYRRYQTPDERVRAVAAALNPYTRLTVSPADLEVEFRS